MNKTTMIEFVKPFYNSQSRFFHNWNHIEDGLNYQELFTNEQYAAWLFHDIVYLPGFSDNEKVSADYLAQYLRNNQSGIDIEVAIQIIMDTKDHAPTIKESSLLLDIDMLCFSFDYGIFALSRELVIQEYVGFFSKEEVLKGVYSFIEKMRGKEIYKTEKFLQFNDKAQENIERYLIENKIFNFDN